MYIDTCSKLKNSYILGTYIMKIVSILKCKYTHVLHIIFSKKSKLMWYKIKTRKTLILHLNKIYKCIYRTSKVFPK
jgi:hypothetical protein